MIKYNYTIKIEPFFSENSVSCSYENIFPKYEFIEKC